MKQRNLVGGLNFTTGKSRPLRISKAAPESISPEANHQEAFYDWIRANGRRAPELLAFRHIPNGGRRVQVTKFSTKLGREVTFSPEGAALKRQGVLRGTLDNLLPIARRGFNSLWIELKVNNNNLEYDLKADWDQLRERERLLRDGNAVHVCWAWTEAAKIAVWYLDLSDLAIMPSRHAFDPQKGHDERCGCTVKLRSIYGG